ncbi:MAG: hypothetical protein J0H64_09575, partial [Actinobacteria bacterium]|nr:hypothetical protein [Actinomycetota bacterium]
MENMVIVPASGTNSSRIQASRALRYTGGSESTFVSREHPETDLTDRPQDCEDELHARAGEHSALWCSKSQGRSKGRGASSKSRATGASAFTHPFERKTPVELPLIVLL